VQFSKIYISLFLRSKTSLEVAENFRAYLPQFEKKSEILDQNLQNCGNIPEILKKTFS